MVSFACGIAEAGGGGGGEAARTVLPWRLSTRPCATLSVSSAMPRRRGGCKAKRRRRGGGRHKRSVEAAARRRAKAHLHQGLVMTGRLAKWPVCRLWLGAAVRLVFQKLCIRSGAADLLGAAALDPASRLRCVAVQDRDAAGSPDVKCDIAGHFCRHGWRLLRGTQTAYLTISTNRKMEGRTLPYIWVQGSPHLALCVARLFTPL